MKLKTLTLAACVVALATAAIAHRGATGMLLERMNAMLAMGEATKAVTPMMRGLEDYDAARTTEFAEVLRTHSGEAMLALFPEGMNAAPSAAKDEVWTNWEEFESLALELALYAEALDLAAPNGLGVAGTPMSTMGADTTTMMGGDTTSMMGSAIELRTLEELAALPVSMLFVQTAQSCSACHTQFRAEE